jgi:hypothetical protein
MSLQLKDMASEVPQDATLECVIGIWRIPQKEQEDSSKSPE